MGSKQKGFKLYIYGGLRQEMYTGYRLFHYEDMDDMSWKTNEIVLGYMFDCLIYGHMYDWSSNLRKTIILKHEVEFMDYEMCGSKSNK